MKARIIALLASARQHLTSLNRGAARYVELQLDTGANDDLFIDSDGLRQRIEAVEHRLERLSASRDDPTVLRLIALGLAHDTNDPRLDDWPARIPERTEELNRLVTAFRALSAGEAEPLLKLDPKEYHAVLHPRSLVVWARALLAQRSADTVDISVLLENALVRSPGLAETYDALSELRRLERDELGERLAEEAHGLLTGSVPLFTNEEGS